VSTLVTIQASGTQGFEGFVGIRLWDGQLINDVMFALLLVQLSVFAIVYRNYIRHFIKMTKDVFLVKERHSLFTQTVSNDVFYRNFMIYQALLLCSLAIYAIGRSYGYVSRLNETQTLLTIAGLFGVSFLFYQFKQFIYFIMGVIMDDHFKYKLWKTSYNAIIGLWGVVLYLPVLWLSFVETYTATPTILFIISYILCRFAIIYKTIRIFYKKKSDLFYLSQGTYSRASTKRRYKDWKAVAEQAGGFTHEYIEKRLTKDEAVNLENKYLNEPPKHWNLINKHTCIKESRELTREMFFEIVEYNESSPTGLVWKNDRGTKNKAGKKAGCRTDDYYRIEISGISYSCHRIIYALIHGKCSRDMTINHINTNSLDNRIGNLEEVTQSLNNKRKSTTGRNAKGVGWEEEIKKGKHGNVSTTYAVCYWRDNNGNKRRKRFSVSRLGLMVAYKLATEHRTKMVISLY
jgi:heme/copper-type cytochrome/quinol oxidase subunit 3